MSEISFFCVGNAAPQGSKIPILLADGKPGLLDPPSLAPWREHLRWAAIRAVEDREPIEGPVVVTLHFLMLRPRSISVRKRPLPTVAPDLDKLARAVLDACSDARVWVDDAQVWYMTASKQYAEPGQRPGVLVKVRQQGIEEKQGRGVEQGGSNSEGGSMV